VGKQTQSNRSISRVSSSRTSTEDYDYFQQLFDPDWAVADGAPPTTRVREKATKRDKAIVASLTDETVGLEGGLQTTYQPGELEAQWLLESLRHFYDLDLLTDILAVVKGGKEASVYRCQGGPATNEELLAAKVYRPRKFRNLRNDKMYREGRQVLTGDGKAVKKSEHRVMRALNKKTSFGQQVAHTSWLMYEFTTLEQLHRAGAAVPRPISASENAILMSYVGDRQRAAPTLHEVRLEFGVARRLLDDVVHNLELMLHADLIHGDLSAYNILYWEGEITLIDFPQVTNAVGNSNARFILNRDVQRVCDYFALQGVNTNARGLADHLWNRFQARSAKDVMADLSRTLAEHAPPEEE
jgi:RIO kinase 1